jgi:hypothetical protein
VCVRASFSSVTPCPHPHSPTHHPPRLLKQGAYETDTKAMSIQNLQVHDPFAEASKGHDGVGVQESLIHIRYATPTTPHHTTPHHTTPHHHPPSYLAAPHHQDATHHIRPRASSGSGTWACWWWVGLTEVHSWCGATSSLSSWEVIEWWVVW